MTGPDPRTRHPMTGFPQVAYLRNVVTRPNIIVGDYTYYDDPDGVERFEQNVMYHFDFVGDKLIIGKFCALATDVRFIMNGANHLMSGFSTYPFQIFGNGWERVMPPMDAFPRKGDTVVGNDVWIGFEGTLLPGVKVGDGAVIAAKSVVASDVPPYAVVGGNPARVIRYRHAEADIARLLELRWWDWPIETITRHARVIATGTVYDLERALSEGRS